MKIVFINCTRKKNSSKMVTSCFSHVGLFTLPSYFKPKTLTLHICRGIKIGLDSLSLRWRKEIQFSPAGSTRYKNSQGWKSCILKQMSVRPNTVRSSCVAWGKMGELQQNKEATMSGNIFFRKFQYRKIIGIGKILYRKVLVANKKFLATLQKNLLPSRQCFRYCLGEGFRNPSHGIHIADRIRKIFCPKNTVYRPIFNKKKLTKGGGGTPPHSGRIFPKN